MNIIGMIGQTIVARILEKNTETINRNRSRLTKTAVNSTTWKNTGREVNQKYNSW